MKAVMLQVDDEFWLSGETCKVTKVTRQGYIIFVDYKHLDGQQGITVFFADDDAPLKVKETA